MDINSYKIAYEELNIEAFMKRYHFVESDQELLSAALRIVCEMMKVDTVICYEKKGITGIATLGAEYDHLQDVMMETHQLMMSYCMECLSMELLSKGYERINEQVYEIAGKWLSTYHFLDSEEMELLANESYWKAVNVVWENGMLKPLKSVIFRANYVMERQKSGCHDCGSCANVNCSFRQVIEEKRKLYTGVESRKKQVSAYSYGANRIFGGHEQ